MSTASLTSAVVGDPDGLAPWIDPWEDLAARSGRPYCAPSWMLTWWRIEAPTRSVLRVVLVLDGDELVGIAPLFAQRAFGGITRYRFLASARGTPIEPLAAAGREADAADAIVAELGRQTPRADVLTIEGATAEWADRLRRASAGSWSARLDRTAEEPYLDLGGRSFDEWFGSRSRNFQQQMRRGERRLADDGFVAHVATDLDGVDRGIAALRDLHGERWSRRGGSRVWRPRTSELLRATAERLVPAGRYRLVTIDDGTTVIGVGLFVGAGTHLSYWLGGFDGGWAANRPGMITAIAGLRDASERGYERVDFGQGLHPYKLRLTDERVPLVWATFVRSGLRGVLPRMVLAPRRGAKALVARVPAGVRDRARERMTRPSWLR